MKTNTAIKYYEICSDNISEYTFFVNNIFPHTHKLEGGSKLHKVSGDSGGWTKHGISYNNNKKLFNNLKQFKQLDYFDASVIAFVEYYLPLHIDILPNNIKLDIFDMAFNVGIYRTAKLIQRFFKIKQDGIIGELTKKYMVHLTPKEVFNIRSSFYYRLIKANSKLVKFKNGWLKRVKKIFNIDETII